LQIITLAFKFPSNSKKSATLSAMLSVTPFRISTGIVFIRWGVFSATFSISVPPADEAIITGPLKPLVQKERVTDFIMI
jgi:hypothetical protein